MKTRSKPMSSPSRRTLLPVWMILGTKLALSPMHAATPVLPQGLPDYQPAGQLSGPLRGGGSLTLHPLMRAWMDAFQSQRDEMLALISE